MTTPTIEDYDQMRKALSAGRLYKTWIEADLSEAIDHDLEGWLDIISTRAVGSPLLQDIQTRVVDFKGNGSDTLVLEVYGDPTAVLDNLEQERWQ